MSLVEDGVLDARMAPSLRIHLDWIRYKTNFRDPVIVRRTTSAQGQPLPLAEIAIDLRQADAARLQSDLARAVKSLDAGCGIQRREPRLSRRLPSLSRLPDLDLQPAVLALSGRLGSGIGQRLRGRAARRVVGCEPPAGGVRFGRRLLDAAARPRRARSAAGRDFRSGDRRRFGCARGRVARPLQGARRAVRHQLLLASAFHPGRLLADQPRACDRRRGAPRQPRERRPARCAESVQGAGGAPLQDHVRAPHQRVRQPPVRRHRAS